MPSSSSSSSSQVGSGNSASSTGSSAESLAGEGASASTGDGEKYLAEYKTFKNFSFIIFPQALPGGSASARRARSAGARTAR